MDYYVIQAFSNCEKKVKAALEERIEMSGLSKMFGEIMIPTEQVTELKKGQKKQMERKFFPGYMLVQMEMNDDTWHLVRKTPNVMGFLGGTRNKPMPLSEISNVTLSAFSFINTLITPCSSGLSFFCFLASIASPAFFKILVIAWLIKVASIDSKIGNSGLKKFIETEG